MILAFAASTVAAGPAHQNLSWVRTGGPVGGLGYDLRFSFGTPNVWFVTDAWSGVFRSTDRGISWEPSPSGMSIDWGPSGDAVPIFSLTVDPSDSSIVWAGTQNTGQIFRSTDGGLSWSERSEGVDPLLRPNLSFRGFTVDPTDSDTVYAMGEIGSAAWNGKQENGLLFDKTMGIVYRTMNAGESWTAIWSGDNLARYCWIDPNDTDVLYISTGIFDREARNTTVSPESAGGVGILKSVDGGATWDVIDDDEGLTSLFVSSLFMSPSDPQELLAAAGHDAWSNRGPVHTGGVFRTTNGGATWTKVLADEVYSVVEYCPSAPNVAYAASYRAFYRSEDSGTTWRRFNRDDGTWGSAGLVAGLPIDLQCDPEDPMRVGVNNYLGGNFLSRNGGQTWISASSGYSGALVRSVAVSPDRSATIFAGTRSGLFRSEDGGEHWLGTQYPPPALILPGALVKLTEIMAVAMDPLEPTRILASSEEAGGILVSQDEGRSWSLASLPSEVQVPLVLAFSPTNSETVYAGVGRKACREEVGVNSEECSTQGSGVLVSMDGGDSWQWSAGSTLDGKAVTAVAAHPVNEDTVLVGTHSYGLYQSLDRGATWTSVGTGLPPLPVLDLEIHPLSPGLVFAGLQEGGVYRSTDGGATFAPANVGLPANARLYSVVVDPSDPQTVYAADLTSGVYLSLNSGGSWQPLGQGLEQRAAKSLALSTDGSVLYLGVKGGGVWRLGEPTRDAAEHDSCADAVELGLGRYAEQFAYNDTDGAASCGAAPGGDLWFRHTATTTGTLRVTTCGSHDVGVLDAGIDTVVSLHTACPGTTANEAPGACSDDWTTGSDPEACVLEDTGAPGDGAVTLPVQEGDEVWIRVGASPAAAQGEIWLTLSLELLSDGFESGDTSAWSDAQGPGAGLLQVAASAANAGNYGLEVTVGATCTGPADLVLEPPLTTLEGDYVGCDSISTHGVQVVGAGATLTAGSLIQFGDAFSVAPGSPLRTSLDFALKDGLAWVEDDSPDGLESYNARFGLRLDELTLAVGDALELFSGYSSSGDVQFKISLVYNDSILSNQLVLSIRQDSGSYISTPAGDGVTVPSGWHEIEVDWETGDGDGHLSLSVDNAPERGLWSVENELQNLDRVRLGNVGAGLTATTGRIQIDGFSSRP